MSTDYRRIPAYMHFWDALNEGRAEMGLPEALYANVRELWEMSMIPTQVEVDCATARLHPGRAKYEKHA